ncbi:MAG: TetR family transcriptional regulator C-terminal domain-containing protein [Pseudomonadota bacterium]
MSRDFFGCELSTQDETIRLKVAQGLRELAVYVEDALREAVKRGDVPPLDVHASAQATIGYMEGIVMLAKIQNDPNVIRRLSAAIPGVLVMKPKAHRRYEKNT